VYVGHFTDLLNPYALLVGAMTVALFALHGALFLHLKSEGPVQERLGRWVWHVWGVFLTLYILVTQYTLLAVRHAASNFEHHPWAVGVVVFSVLAIAYIPRALFLGRHGRAFVASSLTIASLVFLFAMALFPDVVRASNDPASSWTVASAASSDKTLRLGLLIAGIGLPFVLAYTGLVYWTFRGKVELDEHSY
jgi:cytochrome d ubiquinol oxidase subunit II